MINNQEIIRIRTLLKGDEKTIMSFWQELIKLGHQRFRIEAVTSTSWWIDLFLPEVLKYGFPPPPPVKNGVTQDWRNTFFWPKSEESLTLLPIFKRINGTNQVVMFLNVNYYGIYYDLTHEVFKPYESVSGKALLIPYNERLRFAKILRKTGMPFDVFLDNPKILPVIDFNNLEDVPEYYFQHASEV